MAEAPDQTLSLEKERRWLILLMVVTGFVANYLSTSETDAQLFSTPEILLGSAFTVLYLYLALRDGESFAWLPGGRGKAVFFTVQLLLIFGISWVMTPSGTMLIALPLAGMAVDELQPRWRWLVYGGMIAGLVVPFGLRHATWTIAFLNALANAGAIFFVVLFTQLRLNERKARKRAEELNVELREANERIAAYAAQELSLAWQIQRSLLPEELPRIPGWQLAVTLIPARETSGDFYDIIPLACGSYGILVADVTDKGLGAALFMALSRTIFRTYALEYENQPARVVQETNQRVMLDTHSSMYVTAFYGVLEPSTGTLTYCNAGHHPPYLLRAGGEGETLTLTNTGVPVGVFDDTEWEQRSVQFTPGDALVLYSDGVTEAENLEGAFFGWERLLQTSRTSLGLPAKHMRDTLISALRVFSQDAPNFDDITLMVVQPDAAPL